MRLRRLLCGGALLLAASSCSAPREYHVVSAARRSSRASATVRLDAPAPCVGPGTETCFNALDDNCNGLIDEGCGVPSGSIAFSIAWEDREADLDLLVTDPNDELVEVGQVSSSGLTKDRDCPGRGDSSCSVNLEIVYLADKMPMSGRYRVAVRLEKLGADAPPVRANLGVRIAESTASRVLALRYPEDERRYAFDLPWPKSSAASPNR